MVVSGYHIALEPICQAYAHENMTFFFLPKGIHTLIEICVKSEIDHLTEYRVPSMGEDATVLEAVIKYIDMWLDKPIQAQQEELLRNENFLLDMESVVSQVEDSVREHLSNTLPNQPFEIVRPYWRGSDFFFGLRT